MYCLSAICLMRFQLGPSSESIWVDCAPLLLLATFQTHLPTSECTACHSYLIDLSHCEQTLQISLTRLTFGHFLSFQLLQRRMNFVVGFQKYPYFEPYLKAILPFLVTFLANADLDPHLNCFDFVINFKIRLATLGSAYDFQVCCWFLSVEYKLNFCLEFVRFCYQNCSTLLSCTCWQLCQIQSQDRLFRYSTLLRSYFLPVFR